MRILGYTIWSFGPIRTVKGACVMTEGMDLEISDSELLARIFARNVTEHDLRQSFDISDSTLRAYRKNTKRGRARVSESRKKLLILDSCLTLLDEEGLTDPVEALKKTRIGNVSLPAFINRYAKDESVLLSVRQALKTKLVIQKVKAITRYRRRYEYLNDETLARASLEEPKLLQELVEDSDLRPSTRGDILQHLAIGAREELFEYIKAKTSALAPHIREAAFIGLFEYYDSDPKTYDVRGHFRAALRTETARGVRATIEELIDDMEG